MIGQLARRRTRPSGISRAEDQADRAVGEVDITTQPTEEARHPDAMEMQLIDRIYDQNTALSFQHVAQGRHFVVIKLDPNWGSEPNSLRERSVLPCCAQPASELSQLDGLSCARWRNQHERASVGQRVKVALESLLVAKVPSPEKASGDAEVGSLARVF
jgi:hypothetical protein